MFLNAVRFSSRIFLSFALLIEEWESKFWLRMIAKAEPDYAANPRTLWREANELHLIFASIFRTSASPCSPPYR